MTIKRVFHPYNVWEDFKFGMWRKIDWKDEKPFLDMSKMFVSDSDLWGSYMIWAIKLWPFGCEHNLSCTGMNRRAWLGQAAACIAIQCPEYITRLAWHELTIDQQNKANDKANETIKIWETKYAENKDWNRCTDGCETPDFMDVRHFRENLPIIQCWERQYGDVAPSIGRSQKKEAKVRTSSNRSRRTIQADNRSCYRLF